MLRRVLPTTLLLAACGGGGGGGSVPPVTSPVRLEADALDLAPLVTTAELAVRLAGDPEQPPVALQVAVELPPALLLAPNDRLAAATQLVTLDGDIVDGRFVVVCGDAQNVQAAPLAKGPLFRVRFVTATPRRTGTFQVRLTQLRACTAAGEDVAAETNPTVVTVVVR